MAVCLLVWWNCIIASSCCTIIEMCLCWPGVAGGGIERKRERERSSSTLGPEQPHCYATQRAVKFSWRSPGRGRVLQKRETQMKCHFSVQRQQQRQSKIYRRRQADKQTERERKRERERVAARSFSGCVFCCCFCLLNMKHLIGKLQQIACNIIERATERIVESGGDCVRPVAHRQLAACGRHTLATN